MPTNINLVPGGSAGVNPASYRLNKIILTNHGGREIDIAGIVTDFSITESIYRPFLMLEMNIRDDVNLLEEYQISGQEKILISFSKYEYQEDFFPEDSYLDEVTVEHTFLATEYPVYAKGSNNRIQAYVMRGISPHAFIAKFKKISRAYNDIASNIIKDILVNDLGYDESKITMSGASTPMMRVIIPNLDPLEAIAWILRRSFDENSAPVYCYETLSDKMLIQSYSDLVSTNNPAHRLYREGKFFNNELLDDHVQAYLQMSSRILNLSSDVRLSKFTAGAQGAYSATSEYVDIAKKTYTQDIFNYTTDFDSMVWLEKGKAVSTQFKPAETERPLAEYDRAHLNFISLNTLAYHTDGQTNYHQSVVGNNLNKALSYTENMDSIIHDLKLYGDATLRPGKSINLHLVKPVDPDVDFRNDKARGDESKDEFLSGRYIVSGLKHNFSNEYYIDARIKKDSFTYVFEQYDEFD
jgi:hypothetical protein